MEMEMLKQTCFQQQLEHHSMLLKNQVLQEFHKQKQLGLHLSLKMMEHCMFTHKLELQHQFNF